MTKDFDLEDPMELVAVTLPGGDAAQALESIILEYLLLGWKPERILALFRSPFYGGSHQLYRQFGEEHVAAKVARLAEQWRQGWLAGGGRHA